MWGEGSGERVPTRDGPCVGGCFPDDSRRCSQVKLGSAADFLLDISETDLSTLTASIKAPSGRDEPCLLKRLPNNHIGEPGCLPDWLGPSGGRRGSLGSFLGKYHTPRSVIR